MKYYRYIWIIFLALICVTCKKDEPAPIIALKVNNITYDITNQDAIVTCDINTNATLQSVILDYSNDSSFAPGEYMYVKMEEVSSQTKQYRATLSPLTKETKYYFRVRAINKYSTSISTTESFTTPATSLPRVITTEPASVSATSATCGGKVTISGGLSVSERGVCYAKYHNPNISDSKISAGTIGLGTFTCNIAGLSENTTYYVRAYATNSKGTAYGEEKTFTTTWNGSKVINYTSSQKLATTTDTLTAGLHIDAFGNNSILSHDFSNGQGTIVFRNNVTTIGDHAFDYCSNLTSITIPSTVTNIGIYAFGECQSLTSITIPHSVISIGDNAFARCFSLTSVAIPSSVKSIGTSPFRNCSNLTSINVASGNSYYRSSNGVLFNYNMTELIQYPAGKSGSYSIPNSVTSIKERAFYCSRSLTSVTIPENVLSMGKFPFSYCDNLQSVEWNATNCATFEDDQYVYPPFQDCKKITTFRIGSNVKILPEGLCYGLPISSISIPDGVTEIGTSAFRECVNLTSITIPYSITTIGASAFYQCTGLTSITCRASTPPTCGYSSFYDVTKSIPVYVPSSAISKYKAATGWKDFTNFKSL